MSIQFPVGLAPVLAQVYQSGAEVTVRQLGELLETPGDVLTVANAVDYFVAQFELELLPEISGGDFDTVRVLRRRDSANDPAARVRSISALGESSKVEFKSSMLCSMRHWQKENTLVELDGLPGEILKTICAFLNTEGGDLLVGVNDDGDICEGVGKDLEVRKWDLDRWQLHLASLIRTRFHEGELVAPYVQMNAVQFESNPVVHIEVLRREQRSFVQKDRDKPHEYFTRTGSRTDSLSLPAFYSHLRARGAQ